MADPIRNRARALLDELGRKSTSSAISPPRSRTSPRPYLAAMGEFRAYFGRSNAFRGGLSERERLSLCLAGVAAGTGSTTIVPASAVLRLDARERRSGGVQVEEGEHLFLDCAAGNRDPEVFIGDFDPGRPSVPPHLGFGYGPHHCLGARPARLEGRIVVEELLDRSCEVAEQPGDVRYRGHLISHGPAEPRFRPGQRRG
ncbi:cytochrome P450 [Lentzea sp. CC55]|uniref:cytochrome P450 n=1 Tax=Lentzea sp. CC55 TaxID=2884909 RepID=UPI001F15A81D|nr:cytochrome P450 [Lentzea sp. CC55]MCG8920927.1 cytochrome P450 [Lentzea sp. CC55]